MTEQPITEKTLVDELMLAFPELEQAYKEKVAEYKGEGLPGNYEVFGSVFAPKLKEELSKGRIADFLRRAAMFIERVCRLGDPEAVNVVWIKIFEWLIFRPRELEVLWPLLGPLTKEKIKDAAQRWSVAGREMGRTQNLPVNNLPKGN